MLRPLDDDLRPRPPDDEDEADLRPRPPDDEDDADLRPRPDDDEDDADLRPRPDDDDPPDEPRALDFFAARRPPDFFAERRPRLPVLLPPRDPRLPPSSSLSALRLPRCDPPDDDDERRELDFDPRRPPPWVLPPRWVEPSPLSASSPPPRRDGRSSPSRIASSVEVSLRACIGRTVMVVSPVWWWWCRDACRFYSTRAAATAATARSRAAIACVAPMRRCSASAASDALTAAVLPAASLTVECAAPLGGVRLREAALPGPGRRVVMARTSMQSATPRAGAGARPRDAVVVRRLVAPVSRAGQAHDERQRVLLRAALHRARDLAEHFLGRVDALALARHAGLGFAMRAGRQ
jgi:hypothetical protein